MKSCKIFILRSMFFFRREQCIMKIQFQQERYEQEGWTWAIHRLPIESDYHDKSFYFNLELLMDFLHTECCGGTYFELQNMNLMLGCRNEDPVNLIFSLPTSCTVMKEIIVYEVWGSHTNAFWDVMPCSLSSRGTCCHHFQDRKIFTMNMEVTVSSPIMVT